MTLTATIILSVIATLTGLFLFLPKSEGSKLLLLLGNTLIKMLAGLGCVEVLQLAGLLGVLQ